MKVYAVEVYGVERRIQRVDGDGRSKDDDGEGDLHKTPP